MENFAKLGLEEDILRSLKELKFEKPTEIQEKAIPLVLKGKDIIAGAATGSGKTLVFGSAIIQNLDVKIEGVKALILTPTRELAEQVSDSIKKFSKHKKFKISAIYGGVSINPQINELHYADIVVGTPGRILDHLQRRTLDLNDVKILVLDEADRMLDMGFIDDVRKIMNKCPSFRQTMLFSATISPEISRISENYMNQPETIFAQTEVDPSKLKQVFYDVEDNMKFSLLVHLVKNDSSGLVMVFCNTQRNTDFVAENLKLNGINAKAIHGGHSQNKRSQTMEDFHSQDIQVLVCTDVAGRGLDIKGVSHVYNYDAPNETSQYVHRIGRTARAGAEGKAVNLISSRDYDNFGRVKRQHPEIIKEEVPEIARARIEFKHKPRSFGGRFGRSSGGFRGGSRGGFRSGSRSSGSRFGRSERRDSGFGDRGSSRFRSRTSRFSRTNSRRF